MDGSEDMGIDVRLIALRTAADCPGNKIEQTLAEAIGKVSATVRATFVAAKGADRYVAGPEDRMT